MKKAEGNTFKIEQVVHYNHLSDKRLAKPSAIVDFLQAVANAHSISSGHSVDQMAAQGIGWMLLKWHVEIERFPKEDEKLILHTWSIPYRRAQAERDFAIEDETGNEIVHAFSRWALLDIAHRRPYKMPEGFYEPCLLENSREVADEDFKIAPVAEDSQLSVREFTVTRRDIDTNGHVNNVYYIDWAVDDIRDDIYDNYHLADIMINYKKECRRGDTIKSLCYTAPYEDGWRTVSYFTDAADEKTIFAEVAFVWN